MAAMEDDAVRMDPNLRNIVEQKSLRWIFVGGKGGVGKTTTSCSLAVALAKARRNVLIISTDPAHNLSDAFGQRFSKTPSPVSGFENLFGMEIDPTIEVDTGDAVGLDAASQSLISELASSIPGIDEAMSFAEMMKQVQQMNFEVIIFDTAPTGHTLRLLSFPTLLQKALAKVMSLRQKFSGIFQQFSSLMDQRTGASIPTEEQLVSRLEQVKQTIDTINAQFRDPEQTTFVCVCIPEFLSLFETERLVQELTKFEIDTHNVVVNQVLMPEPGSNCRKCAARVRMQKKYVEQILVLYDTFNVTVMPQLDEEVRGVSGLEAFSKLLMSPPAYQPNALSTPAAAGASK